MGFKEGALKADPAILEPVMKVEVVTPEDYMGDVVGDLNRRRGMISGMDETPAGKIVRADVAGDFCIFGDALQVARKNRDPGFVGFADGRPDRDAVGRIEDNRDDVL